MMGMITSNKTPQQALEELQKVPSYGSIDFVKEVTTLVPYQWQPEGSKSIYHIVVLDCGLKYNILRILNRLGCSVTAVPCTMSAGEILTLNPDGILLSPGPGNPELLDYIVATVRQLIGKKPIMGICLGNQLIARELATGRIHITAQNHGYAIDPDTLRDGLEVTHVNLNDGTVEGLKHKELPVFAIQYHSEASPGPWDNTYLFDRFLEMVKESK
jgi:carbamoyl-phosphate synthase small subunit